MKPQFRYNGEYNSEKKQHMQETIEYILNQDYGTTISLDKMGQLLHYNVNDEKELKKFKSTMARVKNFCIDYGYILKTITNVGYYILKPKQISGYCYHTYIRRLPLLLQKSERILTHIDETELSEIRMKEKDEVIDLNLDLNTAIDKTTKGSMYYNNISEYANLDD